MLSAFTSHPRIAPLLKNGQLKEHSAHLVPEGGYKAMPQLGGTVMLSLAMQRVCV